MSHHMRTVADRLGKANFWFRAAGVAVAIPALVAAIRWQLESPGSSRRFAVSVIIVATAAIWQFKPDRAYAWLWIYGAGVGLTIATSFLIRTWAIELVILVISLLWVTTGLWLFAHQHRRSGSLAFGIGVVFSLVTIVELLPIVHAPPLEHQRDPKFGMRDRDMLYRHQPNVLSRERSFDRNQQEVWSITIEIGPDGDRIVHGRPATGPRWHFHGASFLFGHGIEKGNTIPEYLQTRMPTVRMYNYGIPGHGTADAYIFMKRELDSHPDVKCCVYVIIDDHIRRTACGMDAVAENGRRPRFVTDGNGLKYLGRAEKKLSQSEQFSVSLFRRSWLYRDFSPRWLRYSLSDGLAVTRKLIHEMSALCQQRDCRFLVFRIPMQEDLAWIDELDVWYDEMDASGLPIIDLDRRFREYFRQSDQSRITFFNGYDRHPIAKYNRLIAGWMAETIAVESDETIGKSRPGN